LFRCGQCILEELARLARRTPPRVQKEDTPVLTAREKEVLRLWRPRVLYSLEDTVREEVIWNFLMG
jgi:hypothetical protein